MEFRPSSIFLGANQPLFLDKNDRFWIVVQGEADVFFVKRSRRNELSSARNFLCSVQKGDILFSLKTGTDFDELSLIVVSSNCKLIEVNKSFIGKLNKEQLSWKIDRWVGKLAKCLGKSNKPKIFTPINQPISLTLNENEIAYPTNGLFWADIRKGHLEIYGQTASARDSTETKNILLPVCEDLWIKSVSDNSEIDLYKTRDAVEDDITLMLSIHHLQSFFLEKIKTQFEVKNKENSDRLRKKITADNNAISGSLNGLKSIVDASTQRSDSSVILPGKGLIVACRLIGKAVGFDFKEPKFVRDYENNLTGKLQAIAQVSNVRIRKVILRGEWWKMENGHLLAFTEADKEPVALIQTSPNSYEIKYTGSKTTERVTGEIAQSLEPIAYMFLYPFDQRMTSVRKVWNFAMRGLYQDGALIILAAFVGSLIGLIPPILSAVLFDDVIPQADRNFLYEVFGIMVVVGVVKALLDLAEGILMLRLETKSNINVQAGLIDHLLRLPITFYRKYSAGDLTMRALGINAIRQIVSNTMLTAILSGAFSIVNLILLFYYDAKLAWIGIGLSIVAVIIISILGFMKLKYDRQLADCDGELQGFLFEFLSGISKVRITGSEKRVFSLWAEKFANFQRLGFKSGNYQNLVEVFTGSYPLITNIFFFSVIYLSVNLATGQEVMVISVGIFIAFLAAFSQFMGDCLAMSMGIISSLNIVPLYERLKPILETETESAGESGDPEELVGDLEFNSVSFRYDPEQPLVLKDISFKIRSGEMVAFVGPSGSGKSTVLRLLLGFEKPERGAVYYDGQDFASLNKNLVRRQIGVVLQHGSLMSGSIYQNIVGNSELTLQDAEEAAKLAGLEEDIKQMPMGMHTIVSEGGSTFSGGQRQRLMIARAIVHKPRIIYMDEATSALDNRTQDIVSQSLDQLQATRIVIAHRLSTIINADRIFVMDQGQIIESGTYEELVAKEGLFSSLVKRQIA